MERRRFITLLGAAAASTTAWPLAVRAQQAALPVVGFLYAAGPSADRVEAFRRGLAESGFIEGRNVAIEYRFADGRYERLPALAAELVRRPVAVLAAGGITATRAAQTSTATIPIVFYTGGDPVKLGLVASLAKPDGNLTGVATLGKVLVAKQLELLHELLPKTVPVAFLVNPSNAVAREEAGDARAAAGVLGRKLIVVEAGSERDFDAAFVAVAREGAGALSCNPTRSSAVGATSSRRWRRDMLFRRCLPFWNTPRRADC